MVGRDHNMAGHYFGLDPKNRKSLKGSKDDMIRYMFLKDYSDGAWITD